MPRRPIGVWVICIYILLTHASSAFSFYQLVAASDADTAWASSYYNNLSFLEIAYLFVNTVLWLVAAAYLFLLKKQAFPLFLVVAVMGAANLVWQAVNPFLSLAPIDQSVVKPILYIGLALGVVILVAMVTYVRRLKNNGVLQ